MTVDSTITMVRSMNEYIKSKIPEAKAAAHKAWWSTPGTVEERQKAVRKAAWKALGGPDQACDQEEGCPWCDDIKNWADYAATEMPDIIFWIARDRHHEAVTQFTAKLKAFV